MSVSDWVSQPVDPAQHMLSEGRLMSPENLFLTEADLLPLTFTTAVHRYTTQLAKPALLPGALLTTEEANVIAALLEELAERLVVHPDARDLSLLARQLSLLLWDRQLP